MLARPAAPARCAALAPLLLFALLSLTALGPQRAAAATLTVTHTTDDATDSGSLRYAIAQANADGGDDTINFAVTGTITLTAANGPLAITAPMTIQGPGAARLALDGGNTGGTSSPNGVEVFSISGGTAGQPVAISGLTIQHGYGQEYSAPGSQVPPVPYGGGAFVGAGANATLTGCTLTGNSAQYGGAIANPAPESNEPYNITHGGTVTLTGCTLTGNSAQNGGGIYNLGTVTLTGCTLTGNSAQNGGGLYDEGGNISRNGTAMLTGCTLAGNTAQYYGGGLYNNGTAMLTNCLITGNSGYSGGGLFSSDHATVTGCTVTGNSSTAQAPLIGGGGVSGNATLTDDILYGNDGGDATSDGPKTYCDIGQSGYGTGAGGAVPDANHNFDADPLFDNEATGYSGATPYSLQPRSPCLRAGTPVPGVTTDILGNPRGNPPDVGAYEPVLMTPVLTGLSPSSAAGGGPAFTLTITGTGFLAGATVTFGGDTGLTPSALSATQLTVTVPAADIAAVGTVPVFVTNSGPNGGRSNTLAFTIQPNIPVLTGLSRYSAIVGGPAFTLTITGTGFLAGATVTFGGDTGLTPSALSATQLTVTVPAADIAAVGTVPVFVTNSGPNGGQSNTLTFTVQPPTLVVTSAADDGGSGTLRSVLAAAQPGDDIVFDPRVFAARQTITLTQGTLVITQNLNVIGPAAGVTVDGAGQYTVVEISNTSGVVSLIGLTLQNGNALAKQSGGGVSVDAGADAALVGCTLTGNTAPSGGGGLANSGTATLTGCTLTGNTAALGGGLASEGTTTLTGCVLAGNTAVSSGAGEGGGVFVQSGSEATLSDCILSGNTAKTTSGSAIAGQGGGLEVEGSATLNDCILSGNSAEAVGGGVFVLGGAGAELTFCTLTGNSTVNVGGGSGITNQGEVDLFNSILYGDARGDELRGTGYTDVRNDDISGIAANNNAIFSADPEFVAPYNAATGAADLHLRPGSPCAGVGVEGSPSDDLDGRPHPLEGRSLGAYEAAPTGPYSLVVESAGDGGTVTYTDAAGTTHAGAPYVLPMSLRADVQCTDDYADAVSITFDPAVFTSRLTIPLSSDLSTLALSELVSITGPAPGVAIDGGYDHATSNGGVRIFLVTVGTPAAPVALSGLTLQNGNAGSDPNGGGGLQNDGGVVALTGCALTGNVAAQGGGLSDIASGAATLTGCALTGNAATQGGTGGGGVFAFGTLTLTDCVLAGNSAPIGGGMLNDGGAATVTECTFTGNSATSGTGGGLANTNTALLTDDILYGDSGGEIANRLGGTTTATYCDIQGGYTGNGNFAADPQFVGSSPPAVRPGSPAVGAGTPGAPNDSYSPVDITGATRDPSHPTVGAYEGTGVAADIQLRAPGAVPYGTTTTLTATVTAPAGGSAPTGSVAFSYTAPGSATPVTFDTVALSVNGGKATASSTAFAAPGGSALPGGDYTVTATYLPDTLRFLTNSTPGQRVTVQPATPTVTVTDNGPNPSVSGQAVSVTVTVAPPAGLTGPATPTGSVTLHGVSGSMTLDSHGTATFTTTALPVGTDTLSAIYNPGADPNYQSAGSPAPQVTQTVDAIASNVTGQVTVTRGGYRLVRATGHYLQPVTLTNNGAALADTVSLALDNLAPGAVTLVGAAGRTQYATPAGSPYVNLPPGGLAKGASATVTLEFTALPTGYTARVLAGAGVR